MLTLKISDHYHFLKWIHTIEFHQSSLIFSCLIFTNDAENQMGVEINIKNVNGGIQFIRAEGITSFKLHYHLAVHLE